MLAQENNFCAKKLKNFCQSQNLPKKRSHTVGPITLKSNNYVINNDIILDLHVYRPIINYNRKFTVL